MSSAKLFKVAAFAVLANGAVAQSAEPQCRKFSEIYTGGKQLCEKMWDDAFEYTEDLDNAYTMWFFGKNTNDAVSQKLWGKEDHEQCHLSYHHKAEPSPEDAGMTECHPWKEDACCSSDTLLAAHKGVTGIEKQNELMTATVFNELYGPEYHWDRCGPLSPACERFFVQEACFYECEPHAGMYRKFADPKYNGGVHGGVSHFNETDENHNTWQLHKMPIRADYCDAWYTACFEDLFCASDGGSYFSCAAEYVKVDEEADKLKVELSEVQEDLTKTGAELEAKAAEYSDLKKQYDDLAATNPTSVGSNAGRNLAMTGLMMLPGLLALYIV